TPDADAPDEGAPDAASPDMGPPPPPDHPLDALPEVPFAGPYGTRTLAVHAGTNWAATGLYLRAGQSASITAEGRWQVGRSFVGPAGNPALGQERGCDKGGLVARVGLRFEDAITCIGAAGEIVAPRDGAVYVGMIASTDLGEAYGERLRLDGYLDVTVTSDGATAPLVRVRELDVGALAAIESGVVELVGDHVIVATTVAEVERDAETVVAALGTLDAIWETEEALRGQGPFRGQRVRFVEDETIVEFAYMLAGNPIRCAPDLLHGGPDQRILRAGEPRTDIWGFAHELGHVFSFANGTWVFQYNNVEVFPNIFTINVLQTLGREAFQPNIETYCDGRAAWMADGDYPTFKADPFLQLCFLMDFTAAYGWEFWQAFYGIIDETPNEQIPVGGNPEHANTWGFLRDAFSQAAGEDVTPIFEAWRVPLP
ncbi:MAG: M60 family metallopeptidase, partial [Myxococcales bacterium]|nr:M60 family metallopeptidase [Myxococcales bacterium]